MQTVFKTDIENIKQNLWKEFKSIDEIFNECKIDSETKQITLKKFITEKRVSFDLDTPDIEKDFKTVTLDEIENALNNLKNQMKFTKV